MPDIVRSWSRGGANFLNRFKHIDPSGKSILICRNHVKPRNQKFFASHFWKSELELRRLIPEEGRWPSPPNVGMGCGGRFCSVDDWTKAYGEVVWSWRRDAGAKFLRSNSQG